MKTPIRILLATALLALPLSLRAEECCATKKAECAAGAASACCAKGGAQSVTLKIRNVDNAALQAKLAKVDGITGVETCSESKFTKVAFSKDKACADKVMAAVKKAGYRIEAQRLTFAVEGLACGACSDKVTKALSKVKGVSANHVCTESKTATVDFNPGKVSAEKVLAAIEAAGFKASEAMN
jgi:copper ion binding protein